MMKNITYAGRKGRCNKMKIRDEGKKEEEEEEEEEERREKRRGCF